MAWFKVDDGLHSSRKLMSIPKRARFAAAGVWAIAGSWAADELTDGFIPDYMLTSWGVPPSAPESLVDSGLWERASGGYLFCNWSEYQPSKEDVDAERAASRARMRELRARRKQGKPLDHAEEQDVFGRTVTNRSENVRNPDPTRPDPTPTTSNEVVKERPAKRGSRLSPDWMPSEASKAKAREDAPNVNHQAEHATFVDYWIAQPGQKGVKTDWEATWRNWMRRKEGDMKPRMTPARQTKTEKNLSVVARYAAMEQAEARGITQ